MPQVNEISWISTFFMFLMFLLFFVLTMQFFSFNLIKSLNIFKLKNFYFMF